MTKYSTFLDCTALVNVPVRSSMLLKPFTILLMTEDLFCLEHVSWLCLSLHYYYYLWEVYWGDISHIESAIQRCNILYHQNYAVFECSKQNFVVFLWQWQINIELKIELITHVELQAELTHIAYCTTTCMKLGYYQASSANFVGWTLDGAPNTHHLPTAHLAAFL